MDTQKLQQAISDFEAACEHYQANLKAYAAGCHELDDQYRELADEQENLNKMLQTIKAQADRLFFNQPLKKRSGAIPLWPAVRDQLNHYLKKS